MNGLGMWIVNNAIKYSASQIFLITNTRLKEEGEVKGVKMKVETYKSRFAKLGTQVTVEVPYDKGMNKFSGFLDMMEEMGIVKSAGAWKKFELPGQEPISFQSKNLDDELFRKIMTHPLIAEEERDLAQLLQSEEVLHEEAETVE
jgi:hypothetical protein